MSTCEGYYSFRGLEARFASSSSSLMCFLMNSKDEKKMALTAHDLLMETPSPRYMCFLKNAIFGAGSAFSPREKSREFRWYMLFAESIGSTPTSAHVQGLHSGDLQIMAHETNPHSPPAATTAYLLLFGLSPAKVFPSCLPLSYTMK